jgi:hypothetical protein
MCKSKHEKAVAENPITAEPNDVRY